MVEVSCIMSYAYPYLYQAHIPRKPVSQNTNAMDTKIEDSNLAFIGSDEDKAAREVGVSSSLCLDRPKMVDCSSLQSVHSIFYQWINLDLDLDLCINPVYLLGYHVIIPTCMPNVQRLTRMHTDPCSLPSPINIITASSRPAVTVPTGCCQS